jgi:hypothetical protein
MGYEIFWPIDPSLSYIPSYLGRTGVNYCDAPFPCSEINFAQADHKFSGSWQIAKYKLINLDHSDWASYLHINRNFEKENKLKELLSLPQEYCLVSKRYGTLPRFAIKEFNVESSLPLIYLEEIAGFSPFDWCGVIEGASEIWSVDSSLFYIIETLDMKASIFNCFPRSGHTLHIDGLFKTPWQFK